MLLLPDSGLKNLDPREFERVVIEEIERIQPHVVVTHAVRGISGLQEHQATLCSIQAVPLRHAVANALDL